MSQQPPSDDAPRGRSSSSADSSSQRGSQRRSPYDASPYDHELSTDPGRPHAYESLYRGSKEHGRPTPRHWEPNLNPPEAPAGDDTYGWLFRPETSGPAPRPSAATPPATPVGSPASRSVDRRPTPASPSRSPEASRADPRPRGRAVLVVLVVVLVLVLGALAAVGMIWQS